MAIAISLIVYVSFGYINSNVQYYEISKYNARVRDIITEKTYRENINDERFIKKNYFNKSFANDSGLSCFGISFLLLTGIAIKKGKN